MTADWYLVKYVADVFKDEPRNIGVVVKNGDKSAARFVGDIGGRFNRRTVKNIVASTETFAAWRDYLLHHLEGGTFDDAVERLRLRPLDNYRVEKRGVLHPPRDANFEAIANELFDELVTVPEPPAPNFKRVVNRILFEGLSLPPGQTIDQDVTFDVDLRGERHELVFDYRYVSGRTSLMERLSLAGHEGLTSGRVNDALFRIQNVATVVHNAIFLVFYDPGREGLTASIERQLRVIERFAYTVDARADDAPVRTGELLGLQVHQTTSS
jgi:hypothetical protein